MLDDTPSHDHAYKDIYLRDEAPPHPGEILREDIFPLLGLTRAALARRLGITTRRLADVLAERRPVTADLALRLGVLLGHGPRYWLGLQMQHDVWATAQPSVLDIQPIIWNRAAKTAAKSLGYR